MANSSRIKLRDLTIAERQELLAKQTGSDIRVLDALNPAHGLSLDQADHMIENAVGIIGIPVGVACNFRINGRDVLVPMATEEPSVVAAASNAARIAASTVGSSPPAPARSCRRRSKSSTSPTRRRPGCACWRAAPNCWTRRPRSTRCWSGSAVGSAT